MMIGVAGGVKREEMVTAVGEDDRAGVIGGVRRDGLGTVVAAGWLPVEAGEMVEALDTVL